MSATPDPIADAHARGRYELAVQLIAGILCTYDIGARDAIIDAAKKSAALGDKQERSVEAAQLLVNGR